MRLMRTTRGGLGQCHSTVNYGRRGRNRGPVSSTNGQSFCAFRSIIPHGFSTMATIGLFRRPRVRLRVDLACDRGSGSLGLSYRRTVDSGYVAGIGNAANRIRRHVPVIHLFLSTLQKHVAVAIEWPAPHQRITGYGLAVFGAGGNAAPGPERRHLWHLSEHRRQPDGHTAA